MNSTHRSVLLSVVVLVVCFCPPGRGQAPEGDKVSRSHNLTNFSYPGGAGEADLLKRLNRNKLLDLIKNDGGLSKEFQDILKRNPALLDEALRRMGQGEGIPDQLDPQSRQQLAERIRDLQKQNTADPVTGGDREIRTNDVPQRPQTDVPIPPERESGPQPGYVPRPNYQPPETPPDTGADKSISKQVQTFAENLAKWDPSLKESRALRQFVRAFSRSEGSDIKLSKLTEANQRLQEQWAKWQQSLALEGLSGKSGPAWPSNWKSPSLPSFGFPRNSGRSLNAPSIPTMSGELPSSDGGWQSVLVLALLVVGGLVLWKFQGGRLSGALQRARGRDRLGNWPVNPAEVRTRDDVVKAFEYLALRSLGLDAQVWNHCVIAEGLGGIEHTGLIQTEKGTIQQAATQLAGLYAYARYAPPQDELPETALVEARHQLCLLAGVSIA